ncbi:MAG: PQQ-binding-like beta-propeller repeat protein, partial [Acidobacteriota bacterium]
AAKDGSVQVLDAGSLSKLAASRSAAGAGALAAWQDAGGAHWILNGSTARKFTGSALEPGWTASHITAPVASAVVNGVVFLAARTTLYALDAATGQSLWTSGNTITSPIPRQGGLAVGGSAVYLGTQDGTFYAFGFPIEH